MPIARLLPALLAAPLLLTLGSCASHEYATQGAWEGGAYGGVGGALVGSFVGLVLFNNAGAGALIGGVGGGMTGAYYGASAGARKDRVENYRRELLEQEAAANAPPPPREPKDPIPSRYDAKDLERRFGKECAEGLAALIECRHDDALALAREGQESKQPEHRLAALWLEALVHEDSAEFEQRDATYERIVELDPQFSRPAQAGAEAQRVLTEIARARVEAGLPVRCP